MSGTGNGEINIEETQTLRNYWGVTRDSSSVSAWFLLSGAWRLHDCVLLFISSISKIICAVIYEKYPEPL